MSLEIVLNKREELALEAILSALDDAIDPDDERDEETWANMAMIRRRVAVALEYRAQSQIFNKRQIRKDRAKVEDTSETI